jgi:serine/threonine protein phosphatase 1
MVSHLLTTPAPGWLSPGARVYAVGDVHGCGDRLLELHQAITADLRRLPAERPLLLHIGDYIDRGPDSAAVVRRLAVGDPVPGARVVNLRGNHEQMMLDALTDSRSQINHWLDNNGGGTLRSWGTAADRPVAEWRQALPPVELAFLQGLPLIHRIDGYVFVHAGLRPGVPLAQQSEEDMLWIRDDFLRVRGSILPDAPELAVVHGHTPSREPEVVGQRIGIDTGAVNGGALTCAVLEGRSVRFLTA